MPNYAVLPIKYDLDGPPSCTDGRGEYRFPMNGEFCMRTEYALFFFAIAFALGICAWAARHSSKAISRPVELLLIELIPPVLGNLIIVLATREWQATIGYYIYFIGMDVVLYGLLRFTFAYCHLPKVKNSYRFGLLALMGVDVAQLLLNFVFHHAFALDRIFTDGSPYYRLIPYFGQTFHRLLGYSIFFSVLVIFLVKTLRSSRINSEHYAVIFVSMVVTGVIQSFFIFSRTPIDRSMICYGLFGLLVFYFALYYRPLLLLDRMLSNIASELPEALFFFDESGQCIWANKPGMELTGVVEDSFHHVNERLGELFGELDLSGGDWSMGKTMNDSTGIKSYVLDKHTLADTKGRLAGSFISVRDNTIEQRTLQREIYNATHDSLTHVYNRAGYDLLFSSIDYRSTWLLLFDGDFFKEVNDTYGHEIGDKVLQKIADTLTHHFRSEDYVCRIGGDEFVVFMLHSDEKQRGLIEKKIRRINEELTRADDGVPAITVSVGAAHGASVSGPNDWFNRADKALYETKRSGRRGVTLFEGEIRAHA